MDLKLCTQRTRSHQVSRGTVAELMKYSVTVRLLHLGVDVVARIAELSDLLRQQFDAVDRVAENDTLVDFQFREQCVQAVHLLSLLNVRIKLCDTAERQFVHQVDAVGTWYEFLAEILNGDWKGRTEQTDLMFRIAIFDNLFQNGLKLR